MISMVTINGVEVTNSNTFLSGVRDSAAAQSDVSAYSRGGRSGVALGNPYYRGFVISLEFTVIGSSMAELVEQRDRLASFFRIIPDKIISQTKDLGFVMADGSTRVIPAIFSPYVSQISPQDTTKSVIQVTAHTQREYFVSVDSFSDSVNVLDLGGFTIPFDVPFDMSNSPSGTPLSIQNQGNAEYYPTVTFYADLDEITLINDTTGKQIEYAGALTTTDELELNFYERTAIKNGTTNALADITGEWWYLAPGYNQIRLITTTGDGYATIQYHHAYQGF